MSRPYKSRGSSVWRERGSLADVEYSHWQSFLPRNTEGAVTLNRQSSMELALLHSREYQTAVEGVYLDALPVSLERFNFDTQWTGGAGLLATRRGDGQVPDGSTDLALTDSLGFRHQFASGGQLLADLSNAMVWEFSGGNISSSSLLSFQFLQPLMRGAFREVQLESLTQSERELLYSVRDFARFRQTFFIDTVGGRGYLGLLEVAQNIRNQESNLVSLRRNLEEHEALAAAGLVSQFQVDQVYQDYEQGRLSLLTAQAAYETALDQYKLQLGLPPTLEAGLDDSDLRQFQLSNPLLDQLTSRNETVRVELLQFDEATLPDTEHLTSAHDALAVILAESLPIVREVEGELANWTARLEAERTTIEMLEPADERRSEFERRAELASRLASILDELVEDAGTTEAQLTQAFEFISGNDRVNALKTLHLVSGETLRQLVTDLFVVQTQVRVFLVDVRPLEMSEARALFVAEQFRLDLRNEQARVVDAYRRTEVAADLLEADLDLALRADLGTDPNRRHPLRFDSSASRLSAGLQFDGPLNRMAERNTWRASQIAYQQARREFMAARDGIAFEVRNNLRVLNRERFQFEITRQQLITAARQVEEAQLKLRSSTEPNSNLTRDLLASLQTLLRTRNGLIGSWVSYETSRMEFYRSLGVLHVDDSGVWINDGETFDNLLDATGDAGVASGFDSHGTIDFLPSSS